MSSTEIKNNEIGNKNHTHSSIHQEIRIFDRVILLNISYHTKPMNKTNTF